MQPQHNRSNLSFLFIFRFVDLNHEQNKWFKKYTNIFQNELVVTVTNTKLCLGSTRVLVLGNKHTDYKAILCVVQTRVEKYFL